MGLKNMPSPNGKQKAGKPHKQRTLCPIFLWQMQSGSGMIRSADLGWGGKK